MKGYRKASHTMYSLHYHFVFIPKYRKPVLRGMWRCSLERRLALADFQSAAELIAFRRW